jgi:tetratricopeptide (TPR) repeat protein
LQKLLDKTKSKYLEVEGKNLGDTVIHMDGEVSTLEIQFDAMTSFESLLLPKRHSQIIDSRDAEKTEMNGFVRIHVESDSDSDSDCDPPSTNGFRRIQITGDDDEDEDDDDDEEEEKVVHTATSCLSNSVGVCTEIESHVGDLTSLKEQGNSLMQEGKVEEAISCYSKCIEIDNHYLPALNNRAQAFLTRKVK